MISSNYIRDYLIKKFDGKYKLISSGREMIIPSIFLTSDPKRHMSINLDTGLWQCFKSGEKGNFINLYAQLERLTYKLAYQKFLVDEFFAEEVKPVPESKNNTEEELNKLFDQDFKKIDLEDTSCRYNSQAVTMLIDRGIIEYGDFYVAEQGLYHGRLIIPYRNRDKIFFFQGRTLSNQNPKYLNFKGMKSSSVLFPFKYDSTDPLYVCEGAIDAMSLQLMGFNATTTISCHVSMAQLEQLKYYQGKIVVAYDNDRAGLDGLRTFELRRRRARMPGFSYCFPPSGFKDWNEAFVKNQQMLQDHLKKYLEFNLNEWDIQKELKALN
jgi:hypothetical protein